MHPTDYLVHFSNVLMLVAYSVRDILWVRRYSPPTKWTPSSATPGRFGIRSTAPVSWRRRCPRHGRVEGHQRARRPPYLRAAPWRKVSRPRLARGDRGRQAGRRAREGVADHRADAGRHRRQGRRRSRHARLDRALRHVCTDAVAAFGANKSGAEAQTVHAMSVTPPDTRTSSTVSLADEDDVRRIVIDTLFGLWATVNNLSRLRQIG